MERTMRGSGTAPKMRRAAHRSGPCSPALPTARGFTPCVVPLISFAQVIYGDTDSIMVYTGSENLAEVVKLGQQIKREVRGGGGGGGGGGRARGSRTNVVRSPLHAWPPPASPSSCQQPTNNQFSQQRHPGACWRWRWLAAWLPPTRPCHASGAGAATQSPPPPCVPPAGQQAVPPAGDRDGRGVQVHAAAQEEEVCVGEGGGRGRRLHCGGAPGCCRRSRRRSSCCFPWCGSAAAAAAAAGGGDEGSRHGRVAAAWTCPSKRAPPLPPRGRPPPVADHGAEGAGHCAP